MIKELEYLKIEQKSELFSYNYRLGAEILEVDDEVIDPEKTGQIQKNNNY